jgi:hypothetical protein
MHALDWGATDGDMTRVMAGDASVPHPNYEHTMALEIEAEPRHVWPWLIQIGYGRGGFYSYDWLDRLLGHLDRPSATRVLPEFQHLREGDAILFGRRRRLPVRTVDELRALVLGASDGGLQWAWEFALYPIAPHRTRLVSRNRARVPSGWRWRLATALFAPAALVMTRRMLLGMQRRAEALAASGGAAAGSSANPGTP